MNIIVCIKQVPDTAEVKLDPETGTLIREGVPSIINPDDKAGLEAALRIKDECGAKVTLVCMGPMQADVALREGLAMGADEAYLVSDRVFGGADTYATSFTIASAIRFIGSFDLIITGRQAIDGDTAQVGPQIAEHLGLPNVSYAEDIKLEGDSIIVRRQYEDRYHVIKAEMPCLITVLSELNKPRYMTPGGILEAYEKEVHMLSNADLNIGKSRIGLNGSPTRVFKSFDKQAKGAGQIVKLDADESVAWLMEKLEEKFII